MSEMRALLLCAGKGTRLLPLTEIFPKCLMPINGRPLLDYWLQMLCDAGIERILVNLHHHADQIKQFIAGSPYAARVSTVYEPELLGTAGTLLANRGFFGDAPILLAHGDNLTILDVDAMLDAHRARPRACEITMMTFVTHDPRSCGIVETSADGVVTAFHEKVPAPPGNVANGAVYILQPSVVGFLVGLGKQTIDFSTEVIPAHMNRIFVYHNAAYHRDIGTLESLLMAQFDFALASGLHRKTGNDRDVWSFYAENKQRVDRFLRALDLALYRAGIGTRIPTHKKTIKRS